MGQSYLYYPLLQLNHSPLKNSASVFHYKEMVFQSLRMEYI